MSLSKMLDYGDTQMVLVRSRYGYGWIAGVEVEDFPVIITVNDNNGEHGVDYYGLMSADNSWFPYATGSAPLEAVTALNEKLKGWEKCDFANVRLGLGILRKLEKFPAIGLQVRPITLKDLDAWQYGWNHGDVRDEDMFV
jgi:hypothetical protein